MTTPRDNSGSISLNSRKEKDNHPDYKGKITIDGKLYWLSGWVKTNDSGDWISLSAKLADATGATAKPAATAIKKPTTISKEPAFDDTIPF